MVAAHRRGAPRRGRIIWPRFALLFLPALVALGLLGAGAASGAVPVALAIQGQQTLKVSDQSLTMQGIASFPQFFQTHDGKRRTVVIVTLRDLRVRGLCVSTKVRTPVGDYIVRITAPRDGPYLGAGDVTFALEDVNQLDALGDHVDLNHGATTADGIPTDIGDVGFLPIHVDGAKFNFNATIRWATANRFHLDGVTLAGGLHQPECY
ncbi:MAG TPA: DUF6230 family protein [Pseudonocardia sp.]